MTKADVISWLEAGGDFLQGLSILPGDGFLMQLFHTCKVQGPTRSNRQMLEYQLCKYVGISEKECRKIKTQSALPIVISIPEPQPTPQQHYVEILETPYIQQERMKLREDYPFLNDRSCPDELKILVADKITTYHTYIEGHKALFQCQTIDDCLVAASRVITNYLENRQIHQELEHFKKRGKILGKHQIFTTIRRINEIRSMNLAQLIGKEKMEMNIWRNKHLMSKQPGNQANSGRQDKISQYEIELKEVKRLLGM
jgi:hypothetical protein